MVSKIRTGRVTPMIVLLAAAVTATPGDNGPELLDYEITAVKGKLLREEPQPESKLRIGDVEQTGAVLRTGWRSGAVVQEETKKARFQLEARTRVRLAGDRPGVLLELEKGRMRAIFEKIGAEHSVERIVTTPSAVLTVRGTDYGVKVDRSGDTTVVVFEGEVEIIDLDRLGPPVRLEAGTSCSISRGQPPGAAYPHSMNGDDWDRGRMPAAMSSGHGSGPAGGGIQGGARPGSGGGGAGQRHGGGL